jgi:hypothetical protein
MEVGRDRLAWGVLRMPGWGKAPRAPFSMLLAGAVLALGGCTYEQEGPPSAHFKQFAAGAPDGNTVKVCHAYGCKSQTEFTFSQADIAELNSLMQGVKRDDTPAEERRALAYAVAWMERRVAPAAGTASDRPSMDMLGSGDTSQQDCVDEATNTTSYLMVLDRNTLIRHHAIERPYAKDDLSHWTHWAAVIRERETGTRYAMDSSSGPNGDNPTVKAANEFYVPDSESSWPVPFALAPIGAR